MKITYLGQAGFLMETNGIKIVIDPYLSDSVAKFEPLNKRRKPVDERFLEIKPDIVLITHFHLDHYDKETLNRFLKNRNDKAWLCLSKNSYDAARKDYEGHNMILFEPKTEFTFDCGVKVSAVKAYHSEEYAVGFIVEAEGKKYYFTGDTLYNENILEDVPDDIYALFVPANGVGNNMNKTDAARFAKKVSPEFAIPCHTGLFDGISLDDFGYSPKIIPEYFKEIEF